MGIFSSLDKIALLTHFPPFYFFFPSNLILPIFYYPLSFTLPTSNLISFLLQISKIRRDEEMSMKDWRIIKQGTIIFLFFIFDS